MGDQFDASIKHSAEWCGPRSGSRLFGLEGGVIARPDYRCARYLTSAKDVSQLPDDQAMEVAFAGRSNAGKSSALNAITDHKSLARTSRTPGRTQLINLFQLSEYHRLVDLPGYGFAKVPEAVRRRWSLAMERYLTRRQALCGLMLVMDIRHPMTELDQRMLRWTAARRLAVHVLLTKCDKLSRGKAAQAVRTMRQRGDIERRLTTFQLFSAVDGRGVDEARGVLDAWFSGEDAPG